MRQPVDLSSLQELRKLQQPGKPDAIARLVTLFLEETAQRLVVLRTAVDTDNATLLEGEAHALKGISGTVGANELLDLAVRLEQFGRDGHTRGAADLVTELELALVRARPIFDRLRGAA
jgi:HPt (histidine-containing phosphotransfer) domain-containing protein